MVQMWNDSLSYQDFARLSNQVGCEGPFIVEIGQMLVRRRDYYNYSSFHKF